MSTVKVNGLVVDYSIDGWGEFKKWLDGTYATLAYIWVDEGLAYQLSLIHI